VEYHRAVQFHHHSPTSSTSSTSPQRIDIEERIHSNKTAVSISAECLPENRSTFFNKFPRKSQLLNLYVNDLAFDLSMANFPHVGPGIVFRSFVVGRQPSPALLAATTTNGSKNPPVSAPPHNYQWSWLLLIPIFRFLSQPNKFVNTAISFTRGCFIS
jgi:hypothetical protein